MVAGLHVLERMWAPTIEHAAALDPSMLDQKVGDGLSFLETLRHLVFGFDAWIRRTALGQDHPYHSFALAYPDTSGTWSPSGLVPWSAVGIDIHARPTLEEVLAGRRENSDLAFALLAEMSDDELRAVPAPSDAPPATRARGSLEVSGRRSWAGSTTRGGTTSTPSETSRWSKGPSRRLARASSRPAPAGRLDGVQKVLTGGARHPGGRTLGPWL